MVVWFLDFVGTVDQVPDWPAKLQSLVDLGDNVVINTGDPSWFREELAACKPELLKPVHCWAKVTPRMGLLDIKSMWPDATRVIMSDDMWVGDFLEDVQTSVDNFRQLHPTWTCEIVRPNALDYAIYKRMKAV